MTSGPRQLNGFTSIPWSFPDDNPADANGWRTTGFHFHNSAYEKPGIHPGLVPLPEPSASHAGAVTNMGRGHHMIRASPVHSTP